MGESVRADAEVSFPAKGRSAEDLEGALADLRKGDVDWRGGRTFSLVYNSGDDDLEEFLEGVARLFIHENALNPFAFPSLQTMEAEVVAMAADLLGAPPRAGSLSSGGTESIFLAVQTAREKAADRGIDRPQLVTADTVHPAFAKAANYLGVEHIRVPVRADLRADPEAMAASVTDRTALVVGSAPCYPYGLIDPIPELAAMAADRGILCHVDACLGGWLLPFLEQLGEPVAPWTFAVPGVTSMSADLHKYGYCFKGASLILYADRELLKRQFFLYDEWPGGLYGSPTTAGTRPAAPMAGAWSAVRYLGADGYLAKAETVRDTTRRFVEGIGSIDGLEITAPPDMSVFEFGAPGLDIGAIGDVMDDRGWNLDRQQGGLHVMVFPGHAAVVERFLHDLADAAAHHGTSRGKSAAYGGVS